MRTSINLENIRAQYVGKWIALENGVVIATSRSYREVMNKVKEKKVKDVHVVYSPTEEEKKMGFLFWCSIEN